MMRLWYFQRARILFSYISKRFHFKSFNFRVWWPQLHEPWYSSKIAASDTDTWKL